MSDWGQVTLAVNGPADPEVIAFELAQALEDATPGIPNMDGSGLIADLTSVRETVIHTTTDLYRREQDPGCLPNEQDLFAQSIIYIADHPDVPGGKRQYNGNINQLHWCIFGREGTEIYGFAYDDLNRLTAAHYPESAQNDAQDFDVSISYADLLGNIGQLSRRGLTGYTDPDQAPTFGLMDDLSYTYAQGQLTQVTESGNPDYGFLNAGTGFGYAYGKLVSAGGRGIQLIEYNELNLPKKILTDEGTIEIVYDAEGVKWYQKTTWTADPPAQYPGGEEEKIYFRGLEIVNNQPTALYHAQGRAVLSPDGSLLRQEYSLRDHLGNTRVVFSDLDADGALDFSPNSPEIVQTNTYYPFGMLIEGMHPIDQADPSQPYRYNGKELTLMGGLYDYGARWYMADLGRWGAVDPLAEKYAGWSSYNYALGNPVRFVDPDGRSAEDFILINSKGNQIARIPCLGEDRYINIDPLPVVEVTASKDDGMQRGGIELLTGTDRFGGRGGPDPEGTADVIIDEILVPAGGGASEPFGAPNVFQTFGAFLNKIFGGGASADQEDNGENNETSSTSPSIFKVPTYDLPEKSQHGDTIHVPELEILDNGNGDTLFGTRVIRFDTTGRKSKSQTGTWKPSERIKD